MIVVWSILAGADRMELENGMELRLLSALEVLEARREAAQLAESRRSGPCAPTHACWPGRWRAEKSRYLTVDGRCWQG